MRRYRLNDDKTVTLIDDGDHVSVGREFGKDRVVTRTQVNECEVSTVFLVLDHNYQGQGEPLVFETIVFGGPLDMELDRYSTWTDALRGHADMVERVKESLAPEQ